MKLSSHLSDQSIQSLMERYYAGEPVASLIQSFELNIPPSQLLSTFPPIIHEELCPFCGINYQTERASRSYSSLYSSNKWTRCPECGHTISGRCGCNNCKKAAERQREKEEAWVRLAITEYFTAAYTTPPGIRSLGFRTSFFLLGLLRAGTDEDLVSILPLNAQTERLSPHREFTGEIVSHLVESRIIFSSPYSAMEAFEFDENGVVGHHINSVSWLSGYLVEGIGLQQLILELEHHIEELLAQESTVQELSSLWKELALHEVIAYLNEVMAKHGFTLRVGNKTRLVINQILGRYSIAQAFNFSWCGVRNAASFYLSQNVSKRHAANTIVGNMQQRAERAEAEGWQIKDYRRSYSNPPSVLASLFSDKVTGLGDRYISQPPIPRNIPQIPKVLKERDL